MVHVLLRYLIFKFCRASRTVRSTKIGLVSVYRDSVVLVVSVDDCGANDSSSCGCDIRVGAFDRYTAG